MFHPGLLALPLLLVAGGCSALAEEPKGVQVTTAFYPLQYIVQRVAGDLAAVENLTAPGTEPHDLELTIRETAMVAQAELVIHQEGFQPAVDEAIAQNATGQVLDAAETVDLRRAESGATDPHFWQDPLLMADVGDAVADQLSEIDPDHSADYATNATALRVDLESLDAAYADGLADCERSTVVVSHDAFGYLTKYAIILAPVAGVSPDAEPTPAALAALQELIADEGITTVFSETLASPRLTETLANDLGIGTGILDPLEGLTDSTDGEDYLTLMRANLAALEEANGCR